MTQLPRAQLSQSLDTPGLAVAPPVSAGVQQANDILRSLGIAGGAANQIGGAAQRVTALREEEKQQFDDISRASAAQDIAKQIPEFEKSVKSGELDHLFTDLGDNETIHGRVEAFLRDRAGPDAPEAYVDQVLKFTPQATQLIVDRNQSIIDESTDAVVRGLRGSGVAGVPLERVVNSMVDAGGGRVSRAEAVDAVVSDKIQQAVTFKRADLLEEAQAVAGPLHASAIQSARNKIADALDADRRQAERDEVAGALNRISTHENAGGNAAALELARSLAASSPEHAQAELRVQIDRLTAQTQAESRQSLAEFVENASRGHTPPEQIGPRVRAFAGTLPEVGDNEVSAEINRAVLGVASEELTRPQPDPDRIDRLRQTLDRPTGAETATLNRMRNQAAEKTQAFAVAAARRELVSRATSQGAVTLMNGGTINQAVPEDVRYIDPRTGEAVKAGGRADVQRESFRGGLTMLAVSETSKALNLTARQLGELTPEQIDQRIQALTPDDRAKLQQSQSDRYLELLSSSRYTDPAATDQFQNFYPRPGSLDSADKVTQDQVAAFQLWQRMFQFGISASHTGSEDIEGRYELATALKQVGAAGNDAEALFLASTADLGRGGPVTTGDVGEAFEALAGDLDFDPQDTALRDLLVRNSNMLVAAGVSKPAAIKRSAMLIGNRHTTINGRPVNFAGSGLDAGSVQGTADTLFRYLSATQDKERLEQLGVSGPADLTIDRDPMSRRWAIVAPGGPAMILSDGEFARVARGIGENDTAFSVFKAETKQALRAQRFREGDSTFLDRFALTDNLPNLLKHGPVGMFAAQQERIESFTNEPLRVSVRLKAPDLDDASDRVKQIILWHERNLQDNIPLSNRVQTSPTLVITGPMLFTP